MSLHALIIFPHLVVAQSLEVLDDEFIQELERVGGVGLLEGAWRETLVDVDPVEGVAGRRKALGHLTEEGGVGP